MQKFDTGGRAARIIQIFFLAAFAIAVIYFIYWIACQIVGTSFDVQCKRNLQEIARALDAYRQDHHKEWPPYLTALCPRYIDSRKLICPRDPFQGRHGAFPDWMVGTMPFKDKDEINYVNLDGPNRTKTDKDSIPCSYLYELNSYPCFWSDERPHSTWLEMNKKWEDRVTRAHLDPQNVMPAVRCLHHLKEGCPPDEGPTFNILVNLLPDVQIYNRTWQTSFPELSPGGAKATPSPARAPAKKK
jgi:hypothetical protein